MNIQENNIKIFKIGFLVGDSKFDFDVKASGENEAKEILKSNLKLMIEELNNK